MSMTFGLVMAKPGTNDGFGVIAGSGGVELGEYRSEHEGRKALLLIRGKKTRQSLWLLSKLWALKLLKSSRNLAILTLNLTLERADYKMFLMN